MKQTTTKGQKTHHTFQTNERGMNKEALKLNSGRGHRKPVRKDKNTGVEKSLSEGRCRLALSYSFSLLVHIAASINVIILLA